MAPKPQYNTGDRRSIKLNTVQLQPLQLIIASFITGRPVRFALNCTTAASSVDHCNIVYNLQIHSFLLYTNSAVRVDKNYNTYRLQTKD